MGRPKLEKPNPLSTQHAKPLRVDQQVRDFLNQFHRGAGDNFNKILRRLLGLDKDEGQKLPKLNLKGKKKPSS